MNRKNEFLESCVVIDTETTQIIGDKTPELLELGYGLYVNGEWVINSELHNATIPITPETSFFNNITQSMVDGKPIFSENINPIPAATDHINPLVAVAHNASFDGLVMSQYGYNPEWICTLEIARKLFMNDEDILNLKQPYLRYKFGILVDADIVLHRTDGDVLICGHLLSILIDMLEVLDIVNDDSPYAPQIIEWLKIPAIVNKYDFGKYKGDIIMDTVDVSHLKWLLWGPMKDPSNPKSLPVMETMQVDSSFYNRHLYYTVLKAYNKRTNSNIRFEISA